MKSKLQQVTKTDINNENEIFYLITSISKSELKDRIKFISKAKVIIKHNEDYIHIEGNQLKNIIDAAWLIDTEKTFEESQYELVMAKYD